MEHIEIIYKDSEIAVCLKKPGLLSEDKGEDCVPALLRKELGADYIGTIHRLDREVGGIMVYALSHSAAGFLSAQAADRRMEKEYAAVVCGMPENSDGMLKDLLLHDRMKNKSYVVSSKRRGVKEAALMYKTVSHRSSDDKILSLLHIRLITGRTHQIRVQFASRGNPLAGDRRYGGRDEQTKVPALYSFRLSFIHPSNKRMEFTAPAPDGYPWDLFTKEELCSKSSYSG